MFGSTRRLDGYISGLNVPGDETTASESHPTEWGSRESNVSIICKYF